MTPQPEMMPLIRAVRSRIEGAGPSKKKLVDGVEVFRRGEMPFLQLEVKRDHMFIDAWLPEDARKEAHASDIARAHDFLGEEAVRIRFERAEDITKVSRWIEAAYRYASKRRPEAAPAGAPMRLDPTSAPGQDNRQPA